MKRLRLARRSLILRLVGLSLLLLLIVQAAGFAVVRASIDRNARAQIARALDRPPLAAAWDSAPEFVPEDQPRYAWGDTFIRTLA